MTTATLNLTDDIIDVRDIIDRFEALDDADAWAEVHALQAILTSLEGYGGDEQWRGDWYPSTLIRDSYFTYYTREMLQDCGTIPRDLPSWVEIDWEATARNIQTDYTPVEIDGATYWYR
jgi:hypothetical protein